MDGRNPFRSLKFQNDLMQTVKKHRNKNFSERSSLDENYSMTNDSH